MAPPPARPAAAGLLAVPVITDADVLERVAAVVSPAARRHRTLWLFFLHRDGTQANIVVPVGDFPERPGAGVVGGVWPAASVARAPGLGSVIITLARPGPSWRAGADRRLLRALRLAASRHATPVRMLVLATPGASASSARSCRRAKEAGPGYRTGNANEPERRYSA